MIGKLYGFVSRFAGWWTLVPFGALSVAFILLTGVVDSPINHSRLMAMSGGVDLLDQRWYYTADEAFRALEAYGEKGRRFYQFFLLGDFLFLIAYSVALCSVLALILRKALPPESAMNRLILLPFLAGGLDYLENFSLLAMLNRYPAHAEIASMTAGIFTLGKWLAASATLLTLAWGLALAVRKR
ncbi:MAG: hypothetical protein HZA04_00465 [Nitrospinae bacterium]|nr:hypothetical protein [Nitrospinota bacterium]